jgi:alanyl-tRNA synthetase
MNWMSCDEIRESYLKFFEERGHVRVKSSSLIPNDPTLLLTVAGMVQFKPYMWGKVKPLYKRAVSVQKCIRTPDIENVGKTSRHHTFFEMLGNFSFGDYFKKDSIKFAWEYSTKVLKLPEDDIWITVYEEDDETYELWNKMIGVPERRIVRLGKEDNFWGPAGDSGPCGPCTELHLDTHRMKGCSKSEDECTPACDECERFIEFWNLVFTELNYENGKFFPLKQKNIDTGLGLERLTALIQGVETNFDTDLFEPIIKQIEYISNVKYHSSKETDVAIRVIADHIRASVFLISDGVLPSNEGRGYILRRITRRAMRYAKILGMKDLSLDKLVYSVVDKYGKVYPELVEKKDFTVEVLKAESKRFSKVLYKGLDVLNDYIESHNPEIVPGNFLFNLHDTYGFPYELAKEICEEKGIKVDSEGFNKAMNNQRETARDNWKGTNSKIVVKKSYENIFEEHGETQFLGYDETSTDAKILEVLKDGEVVESLNKEDIGEIITDKTVFYAEKGGQVGDKGFIQNGNFKAEVLDTYLPKGELISHKVKIIEGKVIKNEDAKLAIDIQRRNSIARNHTATHLLHAALRKVVGSHIKQAGSYVDDQRLRFDFSHFEQIDKKTLNKIENMVNEVILKNIKVITNQLPIEEAMKKDAMALFTDKYGDVVRVVEISDFSSEFCGGTHVRMTGDIGLFKIISESSAAAGVRRIEAITGMNSLKYVQDTEKTLLNIFAKLKTDAKNVDSSIEKLFSTIKSNKQEIEDLKKRLASKTEAEMEEINSIKFIFNLSNFDPSTLKTIADTAISKNPNKAVFIGISKNSGFLVVKVTKDIEKELSANFIIKEITAIANGRGGGRPNFAQGNIKDLNKIDEIQNKVREILKGV